jgi:hypothetical protein
MVVTLNIFAEFSVIKRNVYAAFERQNSGEREPRKMDRMREVEKGKVKK